MRPAPVLLLATLLACAAAAPARAQATFPPANGQVLAGLEAVEAQALVLNWLEIGGDREQFRREADRAFRSALPRVGVRVDGGVSHFLFCELKVAGAGRGVAVYSWAVSLYEFVVGGVHRLQWTTGGIVRVGADNFSGSTAVEECADGFGQEWARWNPQGAGGA